jgi:hypothetical protein
MTKALIRNMQQAERDAHEAEIWAPTSRWSMQVPVQPIQTFVPQDSAWQPEKPHGIDPTDPILSGAPSEPCQHTTRIVSADRSVRCFDCGLVIKHGREPVK